MKRYKVGEVFQYKGLTLKVEIVKGVHFNSLIVKKLPCTTSCRPDHESVIFKEVKNMNKRPEIKAGMLIETASNYKYLVVPNEHGELVGFGITVTWCSDFNNLNIIKIGYPKCYYNSNKTDFGKVIWEKPNEVILTMDEIAEKFGVDVNNLKIKK